MNKKVLNGMFWLLMVLCVVIVALEMWHGITPLVVALIIPYVGIGGFYIGAITEKKAIKTLGLK